MTSLDTPVGVVPAGGRASRLGHIPCNKEILPVGFDEAEDGLQLRPACADLLEAMAVAGADRAVVALADGKEDVRRYLGRRSFGLELTFVGVGDSPSTPVTVAHAAPLVAGKTVLFGFPDILFQPRDALARLRERLLSSQAAVVLGLFPTDEPEKVDMVEIDANGRVLTVVPKPAATTLDRAWILAAWTPSFTEFLAEHAADAGPDERELYIGDVISSAAAAGLVVEGLELADASFLDIGTPQDLWTALRLRL